MKTECCVTVLLIPLFSAWPVPLSPIVTAAFPVTAAATASAFQ
jgi:hypothetical protein